MTKKNASGKSTLDYEKLVQTPEFKELVQRKKAFSTPYVILFFGAFFLLPILTGYTTILEKSMFGAMTWTWGYSFGMFILVWVLTSIYMNKAKDFDKDVDKIIQKNILK